MLPLVAEIVEVPAPTAVASPVLLIVATVPVPDAHTALLSTCVELSLNVPVAVNCCVAPLVIEGFAGVTAIDTSVVGVTVSSVEPLMLPLVAEIVEVPAPTAVASPVLLIVATVPVPDAHTALLSTCVELSLNVPVAVNCCVIPLVIEGFAGVTAIDTSVAGVTVSSVEPLMLPLVAEIVEVPAPTAVASPVLLIVATVPVPDAHTALLSTCVELSLNVPVAVNCCVAPLVIEGFAGVTAIDTSVVGVTVSSVEPLMLPLVAEIVEVPAPTAVASPVLLIVATVPVPDAHTALLSTCVELSLNVPVAVNCCVAPLVIEGFAGVTAIDTSVVGVTVSSVEPLMLPLVAEIVEVPAPTAVASPVLLIVATVPVPDAHTALLSTCVELSLNVPVAVNCCVAPLVIEGFAGVTAIDTSVVGVTVSSVEPLMLPLVAEIVEVPAPTAVASPVLLIVATVPVPDAHTALLSTCVELSLNVPVAVNCCVAPLVIEGFAGVTAIDTSVVGVTVSSVEPLMLPLVAEIVEVPAPTAVASPVLLIVATVPVPDAHTALLSTCVELSLNVPVAVNCCVAPLVIEGFAGVTAIDTSVAGVTVSSVEPLMLPLVAEIVEVPAPTAVASPVLLIVATVPVPVPDAHTVLLSTCVELSLNVPVAVNCCVAPLVIEGFAGVTAIDTSVVGVTVSSVEPLMLPLVAEIVEVPAPTAVASPVLLIVATVPVPDADAHTVLLSTCVELSLNVPVAVNCCVAPLVIEGFAGVTAIDTSVAGVTVSSVEPVMLPTVAEIVEVPAPTAVAKPVALMVATPGAADAHTVLLRTCVAQ